MTLCTLLSQILLYIKTTSTAAHQETAFSTIKPTHSDYFTTMHPTDSTGYSDSIRSRNESVLLSLTTIT